MNTTRWNRIVAEHAELVAAVQEAEVAAYAARRELEDAFSRASGQKERHEAHVADQEAWAAYHAATDALLEVIAMERA